MRFKIIILVLVFLFLISIVWGKEHRISYIAYAEEFTVLEPLPLSLEAPPLSVEEKIRQTAIYYNYPPEKAVKIAYAESRFNPLAKSPISSASGVFQFIKSTWAENCIGDVFDEDDNIECGVRLLSEGHEYRWNASRHVWGKE